MLRIIKIAIARELWNSSKDQNKLGSCYCMKKCGFAQNHNTGKYKQICSDLLSTNLENLILHAVATVHELWKYSFQEVFYHGAVLKTVKFR